MTIKPILIVEDDHAVRDLVAEVLQEEGYVVVTAKNGEEALGAITEFQPSLVVTDLQMPKMDGATLVERLRESGPSLPILVMSATLDAKVKVRRLGVKAFLPKPFNLRQLLTMVALLVT